MKVSQAYNCSKSLLRRCYWNYGVCVLRFHIFPDSTLSLACLYDSHRASLEPRRVLSSLPSEKIACMGGLARGRWNEDSWSMFYVFSWIV